MKLEQGQYADAEPLLREALEGQQKISPDTWRRYYTESLLGACFSGLGKYADAERLLLSGYKGLLARQASMPFENRAALDEVRLSIGEFYRVSGKPVPTIDGKLF